MPKALLVTCSYETSDIIAKLKVRITKLTCILPFYI